MYLLSYECKCDNHFRVLIDTNCCEYECPKCGNICNENDLYNKTEVIDKRISEQEADKMVADTE